MTNTVPVRLALLEGDGIGPELVRAVRAVLEQTAPQFNLEFEFVEASYGWKAYEIGGNTVPQTTEEALISCPGWIVGPVSAGEYPSDDTRGGHPSGYLRRRYNLFANVRSVSSRFARSPILEQVETTVVRENTEGMYPDRNMHVGHGEFSPSPGVGISMRVITADASERFARVLVDLAQSKSVEVVQIVHKRTALPITDGIFIEAVEAAGKRSGIEFELIRIDTFSSQFPISPKRFRLVGTTNMFGDIISDQIAGLAGGTGIAGSVNVGPEHAMAQASHGVARDLVGLNRANPTALLLSTTAMLRWISGREREGKASNPNTQSGLVRLADELEDGVSRIVKSDGGTIDVGGTTSTSGFVKLLVDDVLRHGL